MQIADIFREAGKEDVSMSQIRIKTFLGEVSINGLVVRDPFQEIKIKEGDVLTVGTVSKRKVWRFDGKNWVKI